MDAPKCRACGKNHWSRVCPEFAGSPRDAEFPNPRPMPRNQKPQEHPQQSKCLRLLKRRAPLLLRKTKGVHFRTAPTRKSSRST